MLESELQKVNHLLVIEDKQGKRTIALETSTCSIGRDSTNSIVLYSHLVSRQHAILLRVTAPETGTCLFRIMDGNLQGKRSTNGLIVNGKRCFYHDLKHGDVIVFGGDVRAKYYTTADLADVKFLTSCAAEDISAFLSTLSIPFPELFLSDSKLEISSEASLARVAFIPELLFNPILDIEEQTAELRCSNEQLRGEIVESQRAEEEVRFLQTMTQAVSESFDFHSALGVALRLVCNFTSWKFGEAWIPSPDGTTLECSPAWYGSNQNLEKFRQLSEGFTFPPATGLPGRVWSSSHPEWMQDVSSEPDTVFLRKQFVMEAGFKAGLGIPIIDNNQVLAVLVFFMFESCEEDKRLVEIVSTVATQLGSLIQRKRAEAALRESEERFRLLVEGVKDYAIFMLDTDGHIVSWNTGAERIKGYRSEEILGTHFSCFYTAEDIALGKPEQALHCCKVNGQIEDEGWRVRKDGSRIWVNVVITAVQDQDGKLRGFSKVSRDITERKRVEEDIRNALEKEKELSELKSRFVSMTSHEFRTPLTTILSSAELLENYSHKWAQEKKIQHLQRIQTAVKHMTQLLNDVLLIGKAEEGKLKCKPAPLDVAQFCSDLVEEMQISIDTHTITFCSEGNCTDACIDEKLLRHILSNLLSNAIKYSPQGGTVHFDLVCEQEKAVFRIQDEGIGIPVADQIKLYDSFHRASNVGTISGTGLGLAIVKKSVDLHGGKIAVKSVVGVGTTFTVTFPLNKQV